MPQPISKTKILLVEGRDEEALFDELLKAVNLAEDIQIVPVGGKSKFLANLKAFRERSDFHDVTSIGIVRDADDNANSAFNSICSALHSAGLPQPREQLQSVAGPPKVTVLIVPGKNQRGMIEDVCLKSVEDDPAIECVDLYFSCLFEVHRSPKDLAASKAKVRAFLAQKELLEIAIFEYLQMCMQNYDLRPPESPAIIVPKIHAFLASRYTPNLNLGVAAKGDSDESRYWKFSHPAFDDIKQFLQLL